MRAALNAIYLVLLQVGFTLPSTSLQMRWSLTRTFSPLPIFIGGNFLWHCPADCSGWALPTTLLFGVRTFLGTLRQRGDPGDSSKVKNTANLGLLVILAYLGESSAMQTGRSVLYSRKGGAAASQPLAVSACLLYTSPSPRDRQKSRMPSSA